MYKKENKISVDQLCNIWFSYKQLSLCYKVTWLIEKGKKWVCSCGQAESVGLLFSINLYFSNANK